MKRPPRNQRDSPRTVPDWPLRRSTQAEKHPNPLLERKKDMTAPHAPRKPDKTFKAGKASIAIWRQQEQAPDGHPRTSFSIRVKKRYCDPGGQWKESSMSVYPEDLPDLRLVMQEAYEYAKLREDDPHAPAAE